MNHILDSNRHYDEARPKSVARIQSSRCDLLGMQNKVLGKVDKKYEF